MSARRIAALLIATGWVMSGVLHAAPPAGLFLKPDRYELKVGERVELSLQRLSDAGVAGAPAAAAADNVPAPVDIAVSSLACDHAFLRLAGTQENRDSLVAMAFAPDLVGEPAAQAAKGQPVATVSVPLTIHGVAMIGCDFSPRVELLGADELRAFLKSVLTAPAFEEASKLIPKDGDVRVRRVETVKTLVNVTTDDPKAIGDRQTAISKTGQMNEIRFTMNPTSTPLGSDVALRVFAKIDKAANAKVIVSCDEANVRREVETSATATGVFTLTHAGAWRAEFHVVKPAKDDPDADLTIYSATATFHTMPSEVRR